MKSICFYHNDADGRLSAAIVKSTYPDCEFVEMAYGFDEEEFCDTYMGTMFEYVFIVDFSFSSDIMQLLKIVAKAEFVWIDHHKSAMELLPELWKSDDIGGFRDLTKAGCMLTWEWFHAHEEAPLVVKYVEDFDLWKFKYGELTKYLAEALYEVKDVEEFETFLTDSKLLNVIINKGRVLYNNKLKRVERALKRGIELEIDGYKAFAVNTPEDASTVGNMICKELGYEIGITYHDIPGKRIFQLRSIGDVDVSAIAKKYKGGGHRNASGFEIKRDIIIL